MVILVDMDDTIEYLLEAWVKLLNERYSRNVDWKQIKEWNTLKAFPGLTRKDVYGVLDEVDFWKTVRPREGARESIEHFISEGHKVYIVTSSSYKSLYGKMEYCLFRYFPFITWDDVIITSHKQMIKGDILIDDGVHNHENGDYISILVDAGYNRDYDDKANNMIRVHNWDEIRKVVDDIAKEKQL